MGGASGRHRRHRAGRRFHVLRRRCGAARPWNGDGSPTLLAAIGDVAHPSWRASAVGIYRLWRDLGYAVGALLAGITADLFGLASAVWLVAGLTLHSGVVAALRMYEALARQAG